MKFNIKFKKYIYRIFLFVLTLAPGVAWGQNTGVGGPPTGTAPSTTINNPIPNITSVQGFIHTILVGMIKIGIPIIALAIVYSGFLFVSALGNSGKLKEAKDSLLYTLIGAAILLGAWAIAQLISDTVLAL